MFSCKMFSCQLVSEKILSCVQTRGRHRVNKIVRLQVRQTQARMISVLTGSTSTHNIWCKRYSFLCSTTPTKIAKILQNLPSITKKHLTLSRNTTLSVKVLPSLLLITKRNLPLFSLNTNVSAKHFNHFLLRTTQSLPVAALSLLAHAFYSVLLVAPVA